MNEPSLLTPAELLTHWLEHRHLTRRVLAAFPEDHLFTFVPAPPMRSFGEMAWELHGQTAYTLHGLLMDDWGEPRWEALPSTDKDDLLAAWDAQTRQIERAVPAVPAGRYGEVKALAWGDMLVFTAVIGTIDNEIHHRGQGMVYLRLLGTAPPDFWERS